MNDVSMVPWISVVMFAAILWVSEQSVLQSSLTMTSYSTSNASKRREIKRRRWKKVSPLIEVTITSQLVSEFVTFSHAILSIVDPNDSASSLTWIELRVLNAAVLLKEKTPEIVTVTVGMT